MKGSTELLVQGEVCPWQPWRLSRHCLDTDSTVIRFTVSEFSVMHNVACPMAQGACCCWKAAEPASYAVFAPVCDLRRGLLNDSLMPSQPQPARGAQVYVHDKLTNGPPAVSMLLQNLVQV